MSNLNKSLDLAEQNVESCLDIRETYQVSSNFPETT